MTNSKNTKRALFTSVVAILLCCTMLLGTTFAWFTDTAVSEHNKIQAGNLDIALQYKTLDTLNGDWEDVTETTELFDSTALWEPGRTEVVFLRVANEGTLALKYNLDVVVNSEQTSINVYDETFSLKDYVQVGAYRMAEYNEGHQYADTLLPILFSSRETTVNQVSSTPDGTGFSNINSLVNGNIYKDAPLSAGEKTSQVIALVLTMPTTVDNHANYKAGEAAPSLDLGISFVATQAQSESDTFGSDYDKDATYPEYEYDSPVKANVVPLTGESLTVDVEGIDGRDSVTLDVGYQFTPQEKSGTAENSPYRYYHADFVVKADKDVPANSMALAGYYSAFCDNFGHDGKWMALTSSDSIAAGTEIRLVEAMGVTVNYKELCEYSFEFNGAVIEEAKQGFHCGAVDLTDANVGTTLTVELRLYEVENADSDSGSHNVETGNYITIGKFKHTF